MSIVNKDDNKQLNIWIKDNDEEMSVATKDDI